MQNNSDYTGLLRKENGSQIKKPRYLVDEIGTQINAIRTIQDLKRTVGASLGMFEGVPNTDATMERMREALISQIERYKPVGASVEVQGVEMRDDGVANVRLVFNPGVEYINLNMNLHE